jgi:electron transfer flavoprotein alpha subunit
MSIVCIIESHEGSVRTASLEALSAARRLKEQGFSGEVLALVPGSLDEAARLGSWGADRVLQLPALAGSLAGDALAAGLFQRLQELAPAAVLIAATARGRDLAPRLAARLEVTQASECTALDFIDGELRLTRPIFAGKVLLKSRLDARPALCTLRGKVFAAEERAAEAAVATLDGTAPELKAVVEEILAGAAGKLDLSEADIIVSGGRGVGGPEGYAPLEALAARLGGVVGASRAAVDAGWRPHSDQVGQTGKVVTPTLYIACGISGAIQHLAGMKNSRYIVAINKDAEAPIFKVADYGIVGDLFEVVPALTAAL